MPEIEAQRLEQSSAKAATARDFPQTKSVLKLVLEMVLISLGVFLALMGEQWRENSQHRELARASLQRFRAEILANRKALGDVTEYHNTTRQKLEEYFASDKPRTSATFDVQFHGLGPVFFEQTAWDLALATQSLAWIDPDLAFALSRAYTIQRGYAAQQAAIVQSTIYGRSWNQDFEGYWRSVLAYYGDLSFLDPTLLGAYDDVLPLIDRALAEGEAGSKLSR